MLTCYGHMLFAAANVSRGGGAAPTARAGCGCGCCVAGSRRGGQGRGGRTAEGGAEGGEAAGAGHLGEVGLVDAEDRVAAPDARPLACFVAPTPVPPHVAVLD